MPKPPRFATEKAQKTAVGVVTFIALCVAVLVAQLYTQAHQVGGEVEVEPARVESLAVDLPRGWTRETMTENEQGFTGSAAQLLENAGGRELVIGRVDVVTPAEPEAVLFLALNHTTANRRGVYVDKGSARRFREGTFAGVIYLGVRQIQDGPTKDGPVTHDWVVILTEDGRRYWKIMLTAPFTANPRVIAANEKLIRRIAASAKDTAFRPADPGFLDPAKLGDHASIAARTDESDADAPVHIPLTDVANPHLGLLRVRRVIDTKITQPKAPLSPAAGLRREFFDVHGREPDAAELTTGLLDDATVTRLKLSAGKKGDLVRELHYISGDEGLLVEVIAEPESLEATLAMIAPVYRASRPVAGGKGAIGEIGDAVKRGQSLAAAQRKLMTAQFTPAQRYFMITRDSHEVGTHIEDVHERKGSELPLRVRAARSINHKVVASHTDSQWLASLDGERIDYVQHTEVRKGLEEHNFAYQVVQREKKLAMSRLPPKSGRDPLWTEPVPDGFLPGLAEARWMWHELEPWTAAGPVLVWRSRGAQAPAPCWLEVRRIGPPSLKAATKPPAAAYNPELVERIALVTIRPIMGMDSECYWLDSDGRVVQSQWTDPAGLPGGGIRLASQLTDAATVVRIDPKNRDILRLWQQEGTRND